jgi:hypothetical protein
MELIIAYSKEVALLGLMLNLAGVILIALSLSKKVGSSRSEGRRAERSQLASFLYPRLFRWGIGSLILGFFLQIITHVYNV